MASADIILFAIQGALRLGFQARAAYVDSTRNREMVLPLPNFEPSPSYTAAANFFSQRDVSKEPAQLQGLVRKLKNDELLTPEEQKLLMLYHEDEVLKSLGSTPAKDGSPVTVMALSALVVIRQWQRGGERNPTALQRLAGTFLEIGVDYFANVPGGLDPNSRIGKGLRAFFVGFDGISFATEPLSDLPARMFSATMESIATNSSLITQEPKVQELITAATKGLATNVARRITKLQETRGADPEGEARIQEWGELVFRSLLSSVGKRLADDPGRFLGVTREANAAMITGVANAAITIVVDQPEGQLQKAFSQPGLERVADAALDVVSRYPELITGDHNRLNQLVSQIATDLAKNDHIFSNQAIPGITQMILSKTAENLPLLWPQAASDPKKHIGLIAATKTLEILTRKPKNDEPWKPAFTAEDLTEATDAALHELVANPGWLISKTGELSPVLSAALESMIGVLRAKGDARLSTQTAIELVKTGVQAAASRSEFLTQMQNKSPIIGAILDAVLGEAFDPGTDSKVQWRMVRSKVLVGLFETAAQKAAQTQLDPSKVTVIKQVLKDSSKAIKNGESWELERFAHDLDKALAAA